jgi:hypothetical protein
MPNFIRRLLEEGRWNFVGQVLLSLVVGFLGWSLVLGLLDLYDVFSPIPETKAPNLIFGSLCVASAVCSALLLKAWWKRPSLKHLAERIESTNSHLKDSLNTAVEIHQSGRVPGVMEKRVLSEVSKKISTIAWDRGVRPNRTFWKYLILGFVAGVLLFYWNTTRSPFLKAHAVLSDLPGIVVNTANAGGVGLSLGPPNDEFKRGTDVSILADLKRKYRGESKVWIEIDGVGQSSQFEMLPSSETSRMEFVIPAIQEEMRYRVFTESLESSWHTVTSYDPPGLEFAHWTIKPPRYLNMAPIVHHGFGYLEVPEGSLVSLDVRVLEQPKNVEAVLLSTDGNHSLTAVGQVTYSREFTLEKEWSAKLKLSDVDKPSRSPVLHDPIILSPIPDEPPLVEITSPAKDLELPFDAEPLLIDLFAIDDHGISDLRLHVSHDGEKKEDPLFLDPIEKEKAVTGILDLSEYPLAVGDVITYMAFAVDNREPEGQVARSEVYFIEILPPEGETLDSEGQAGGMDEETKEIPIRQFINRTKKIFRDTYDAMLEEGEIRKDQSLAICTDSLDLKHEMTKTYDEFAGRFPISNGIDLGELLNEATYHIEQTEIYTGDYLLEESLESTEQTLRKLVQLYALMQELEKQKAKGQGQSTESSAKEGEAQEGNETAENPKDASQQLEELSKQLEQLNQLKDRQDSLNDQIGQAAGSGQKGKPNQELAGDQADLRRDLQDFRDRRYDQTGKLSDVSDLDQAGREMKEGTGDLRRDSPGQAQPHGELASEALGKAVSKIEREMAQLAANMVEELTEQAQQLGQQQGNLRQKTDHAQGGQGEPLRDEQQSINGGVENLMQKIDRTARTLGKHREEALENLLKAMREARASEMERAGKQASNALLYDAFPQASKQQEQLEEGLSELGSQLQKVEDKLRHGDSAELAELAEHLEAMRRELAGMGEEQFRQSNEEAARLVGNLDGSESDERLINITRQFEESAISEDAMNGRSLSSGAVKDASQLVEQFFWERAIQERLLKNHQSTRAPARYRKQVEKYFRRIAEGK